MTYLSRVRYTGTGATALYSIPFAYISKAYIEVRVGGTRIYENVGYSWQSPTSILLLTGNLPTGTVLEIKRATPSGQKLVDFQDGSVLTEASLDLSSDQVFQLVQEVADDMADRVAIQADGTVDALGARVKNVSDPVALQDATTKKYVDELALGGTIALPIPIESGGTGATTPGSALAAIGGLSPTGAATVSNKTLDASCSLAGRAASADVSDYSTYAANAGTAGTATLAYTVADGAISTPAKVANQVILPQHLARVPGEVTASVAAMAAFDVTNLPSWVTRVDVIFRGVSVASADRLQVQVGDSAYKTSSYVGGGEATAGYFALSTGFATGPNLVANAPYSGVLYITRLTSGGADWVSTSVGVSSSVIHNGAGDVSLSAPLSMVRVDIVGAALFTAGTITIRWYP